MHSSFLNKWDEPSMLHELLAKHPLISSSPAPRSKPKLMWVPVNFLGCEIKGAPLHSLVKGFKFAVYSHLHKKPCFKFGTETIILF